MLRLIFLGTRGNTVIMTRRHRRHSAALLDAGAGRVMIDCGGDWLHRVDAIRPDAIVLTHAHPDHAAGLRDGASCPVFATAKTWATLGRPVADPRLILPRVPIRICRMRFEAFPVQHSLLAPAVGYRISAGGATIFYVPDLVSIRDRHAALGGVALYVGDGARLTRPLVRGHGRGRTGHAPVTTQLAWCALEGVRRAVFTHCGTGILSADGRRIAAIVRAFGEEGGVQAAVAHDGQRLTFRDSRRRPRAASQAPVPGATRRSRAASSVSGRRMP